MATENRQTETPDPGITEIPPTIFNRWKLVIAGLGAILTFAGVIGLSLPLKAMIATGVAILWGALELIVLLKLNKIKKQFRGEAAKSSEAISRKIFLQKRVSDIRWTAGGILVVILLAAGIKELERCLTPPKPPMAESIYSMIVLDATESMLLPFEGSSNKWEAVQSAFQDYFIRANELSHYGLIVIGGQNPKESINETCEVPTVPLIPLAVRDGRGNMILGEDVSLAHLQTEIENQKPQGDGSLIRGFFLAKNQLEKLPEDEDAIRIIVLVASASDTCEGNIDWDKLINDIQLTNKEIVIHKELIFLDKEPPAGLVEAMAPNGVTDQSLEDSGIYIRTAKDYGELAQIISDLMDFLNSSSTPTPTPEVTAIGSTGVTASPTLRDAEMAARTKSRTKPTTVPSLVAVTSTITCTPTLRSTVSVVPLATTAKERFPASTMTFTSTSTYTPTFTMTPITPIPTQTKKIKTVAPEPTNTPPPTEPPARCGALCMDGTTTTSTGSGACSSHGGVKEWLYPPNCP